MGCIALAVMITSSVLLQNRPEESGLKPLGSKHRAGTSSSTLEPPPVQAGRMIFRLGLIYFLFGFTYVIYATFIVTVLVEERGFSEVLAGNFWMWAGAFSIFSGPVFGSLSDRFGRRSGLMAVFVLHTIAYLLVALNLPGVFAYLSIFLWGICVWAVPAIMAVIVGDYLGVKRAATAFATITLFFGAGQIVGPGLAGILADMMGGFSGTFVMAAAMTALAAFLCGALDRPARK